LEKNRKVKLPEPQAHRRTTLPQEYQEKESLRVLILDENNCVVYGEEQLMMCSLDFQVPKWCYVPPEPVFSAPPISSGENIIVASRSKYWFEKLTEAESFIEKQLSTSDFRFFYESEAKKPLTSAVSAVALASGAQIWTTNFENLLVSDLLTDETQVYFVAYSSDEEADSVSKEGRDCGGDIPCEQKPFISQLWALESATGKPKWKVEAEGYFSWPPRSSSEGILFATYQFLYLVSPAGEIKWQYPLKNNRAVAVEPYEGLLLMALSDGLVNCLSLTTGELKWRTKIGEKASKIVVSAPMAFVGGLVRKEIEPTQVIPTKRWQGSEDLLKNGLKKPEIAYEGILYAIDLETGDVRWSIPKISGVFHFSQAFLYTLRHAERIQIYNPNAETGELSRTISHLRAFDAMSGEKIWEKNIDGYCTDMRVTENAIIVTSEQGVHTPGSYPDVAPIRLVGISVE